MNYKRLALFALLSAAAFEQARSSTLAQKQTGSLDSDDAILNSLNALSEVASVDDEEMITNLLA